MNVQVFRFCTLFLLNVVFCAGLSAGGVYGNYYVKASATGAGDGSSWTDAFTDLQLAIDNAQMGDVICVAAGTYFPTHLHLGDSPRHSTFYFNKDIVILGGFSGEPGTEGSMEGRDPQVHLTTLSGDIGILGDHVDNAFHVVYFDHVSDTTRLDGFEIAHGNGFGGSGYEALGAGIFNNAEFTRSNPVIANCIIRDNNTSESAGGFLNHAQNGGQANPLVLNCTFIRNRASGGGAMVNYTDEGGTASPTVVGSSFMANSAPTADGGAISNIAHSATVSPRFINCIISGNFSSSSSAAFSGFVTGTGVTVPEFINCAITGNTSGSIRVVDLAQNNSLLRIRNSIVWANGSGANHGITTTGADIDATFSVIPFGFAGEGIIGLDPMFVFQPPIDSAHTLGDLHLLPESPAFDAGRNTDVPAGTTTDLDGNSRFINATNGQAGIVDIGPYEFQGTTSLKDFILLKADWHLFPNPATDRVVVTFPEFRYFGYAQLHDIHGRLIQSQRLDPGQIECRFDVADLTSGVYLVHLLLDGRSGAEKITITE